MGDVSKVTNSGDKPESDPRHTPPTAPLSPSTLRNDSMVSLEGACVDSGRAIRCGFGEVIYGEGKSTDLIERIAETLLKTQPTVLVTRLCDESAAELSQRFPAVRHCPEAKTLRIGLSAIVDPVPHRDSPTVAVVTAGSTDRGPAAEARETLAWMGIPTLWFEDVGVAGPQRLQAIVNDLRACQTIVVAAGMEGALPSVVAGHVRCPVIALPTSVGYGAAFGGITAMLGMLTSCAAGVAVVNIDAGFKAGYLAGMIACGPKVSD